jgi:hypothetical protein
MGTIGFVTEHIPDLATIAAPLTRLTGKVPWQWGPEESAAFQMLKDTIPAVLRPIDWSKVETGEWACFVFTDACIEGIGGCLAMGPTRQTAIPCKFHSRKFSPAQRNYFTRDQEMLGVVENVSAFSEHLLGHRFTVCTDHNSLKHFFTQPTLTSRQIRWGLQLAMFDFDVEYIPGRENAIADAWSRYWEVFPHAQRETDVCDVPCDFEGSLSVAAFATVASAFTRATIVPALVSDLPTESFAVLETFDPSFLAALRDGYQSDGLFKPILEHPDRFPSYHVSTDGLILLQDKDQWRLCIPRGRLQLAESCPSLREYILSTCHSLLGHLGFRKTLEYARRFFWWRTMRDDADAFVRTCETCARIKPSTQAPAGLLHSLPVPSRPWQGIAVDFIGPLPEGEYRGMIYDTIMTVTCLFTKEVRLVRFRSDFTAKDLAQFFFDDVYCHKLFPEYIVSDRDKLFTSSFWSELSHLLGIELRRSTAYHPQTDGSSERTNRTVKQTLQAFVEYAQPNWPL